METSNGLTGETLFNLTLYAAAIPANHSVKPETVAAKTTLDTCGHGYEMPLADYDPDTQSWRMFGDTYLWGQPPLLESLPPSGMTRKGVLYQQPAWVPIIDETASLSWPTPRAAMHESRNHTVWARPLDKPQNLENRVAQIDRSAIGGKLNPTWVEWLMGFPTGWTDLED